MKPSVLDILKEKEEEIYTVTPEVTVIEAAAVMKKNHGAAAVIEEGKLAGVCTERDILNKVILGGLSLEKTTVGDIMTRKVIYAAPDFTPAKCLDIMSENNIRHLPVVEDEKVLGMVSIFDMVKRIISDQKAIISHLTEYIELSY
jgi:CBS domain-containing protein